MIQYNERKKLREEEENKVTEENKIDLDSNKFMIKVNAFKP